MKNPKELLPIYQDAYLAAINKPHGLLVHRTGIAGDATEFAVQLLRDMLGRHVYPVHRLDRKTSGVLIFALDAETNGRMQQLFAERQIHKKYLAIVRGYTADQGTIDYPLVDERGASREALTHYTTLAHGEIEIPGQRFATSRYSLVEVNPITGRTHQIRRHFAHILHPIIGDRPHGCNKQNRLFKSYFRMNTMLLCCIGMSFRHPATAEYLTVTAPVSAEFGRMASALGFDKAL
ncbi:MAG: pseudouridylate synthase [Clostridia bacterium]|nr:pseudouridylate synthase [Clostridia bacterium]